MDDKVRKKENKHLLFGNFMNRIAICDIIIARFISLVHS